MNSMRDLSMRWSAINREATGPAWLWLIALSLLCAVVFVGFYAIGRANVPASAPQLQPTAGLTLSYSGAAIPASLSSAPSIDTIAFPAAPAKHARTPATHAPAVEATPSTAPQLTPTPVATPSPAAPAPVSHPQTHKSSSVPFDSSG
jgi:hypothetical protein